MNPSDFVDLTSSMIIISYIYIKLFLTKSEVPYKKIVKPAEAKSKVKITKKIKIKINPCQIYKKVGREI